jgi:hypothetical protein
MPPREPALPPPDARLAAAAAGIAAVFGLGLLAQVASPLRLNVDVVFYLSIAESALAGDGFRYEGESTHYPPGYPALLASLAWLGLGAPWAIVLVNIACLGAGLWAAWRMLLGPLQFRPEVAAVACALMPASFAVIKHAPLAMSEFVFFALLMGCLLALASMREAPGWRRRAALFTLAALLAVLAFTVRTAAVALVAALVVAWAPPPERWRAGYRWLRARPMLLVAAAAFLGVMAVTAAIVVIGSDYVEQLVAQHEARGVAAVLWWSVRSTFTEWGETVINLPFERVRGSIPGARWVFATAGLLAIAAVVSGIFRRRARFGPVEAFVLAYLGMLLVWPSHDARFWIPLFPLIVAYAVAGASGARWGRQRMVAAVLVGWFVIAGTMALAFSTRSSMASGAEFPARYGSVAFAPSYLAALGQYDPRDLDEFQFRAYEVVRRWGRSDQYVAGVGTTRAARQPGLVRIAGHVGELRERQQGAAGGGAPSPLAAQGVRDQVPVEAERLRGQVALGAEAVVVEGAAAVVAVLPPE